MSAARDTGLRAASATATVTCTPRAVPRNVTAATRSVAGRTTTAAEATSEAPAAAVTVPAPSSRPALNVTTPPWRRTNVPSAAGETLQFTPVGTAFPNASVAAAVNRASPRARSSRRLGVTAMRAVGPATIVSSVVACVVPGAAAVNVARPARVSR